MKKLILSALVVGSLFATSCKKTKDAVKDGAEVVKGGANAVAGAAKDGANVVAGAAKDGANAAAGLAKDGVDAVKSVVGLDGVSIPEFKDAKVGEHLQAYASYAKEYIAGGADVAKNTELMKKGADLLAKGKEILGGLDAESATKFNTVMTAIQSKMAPAK